MIRIDPSSLAELRQRILAVEGPHQPSVDSARNIQAALTKPPGSLGRLESMVEFLAGWQRRDRPELNNVQALVFAGNHGVCKQGVNPYPQSVTAQMVDNFRAGGAAINQLCESFGAKLSVIDIRLDTPTVDFTEALALPEEDCLAAVRVGLTAVDVHADALVIGEMGIGNSTVAAALAAALYKEPANDWVGPGTGASADVLDRKINAVTQGLALHADRLEDPLQVLCAFGGREQAAILGALLAARERSVPVILDGFICCAAAAIMHRLHPASLDHCIAGHCSAEPGHARLLARLEMKPLLQLDMRLGEGTGAALALAILRGAVACHNGMATFASAGLDGSPPTADEDRRIVLISVFVSTFRRVTNDLRAALMLLTRLPAWRPIEGPAPDLSASIWAYPLVGFLVGGLSASVFIAADRLGVPRPLAAILAVTVSVLLTGAFHEDGLADTADGLGGGLTRERKLEIMRDSRIGTYGTLAIVLSLAIRITSLATLADVATAASALASIGAVSRGSIVLLLAVLPPARSDGMAAVAAPPSLPVTLLGLALAIGSVAFWPPRQAMVLVAATLLGTGLSFRLANKQLGGYTGDLLGAGQQISASLAWIALAALSR